MTRSHLVLAAISVTLLGVIGVLWLRAHDAQIRAQAQNAVLQGKVQDAAKQIADAKQEQVSIASNLKEELSRIEQQRTVVITPQQAAAAIPQIVPNLPKPVTVVPEVADSAQSGGKQPNVTQTAPGDLVVPKADIPAFQQYVLDAKECTAKLDACQLNQAQDKIQQDAKDAQIADYEQEVKNLQKAQGNGFWHRLGQCGVRVGVGAAAGAIGGKQQGAAIGGGIGLGSCLVFR